MASPMPFSVPMPFSMLSSALSCLALAVSQSCKLIFSVHLHSCICLVFLRLSPSRHGVYHPATSSMGCMLLSIAVEDC